MNTNFDSFRAWLGPSHDDDMAVEVEPRLTVALAVLA